MALPPGFLDELRARVSIAAVVGRKVIWDSRKTNGARGDFWAPCPFHQEKTASFHVEEAKGRYHCFGCQAGGDAVSFLRETEGLGFIEAVERLAAEAGMEMPARDPAAAARAAANQGLVEAMEAAVRFFRAQLNGARAAEARAYLQRRGLSAAALERFEIGYAPEARTDLLGHLTGKGFARETLAEAGLVGLPRDGGGAYDRFRNRIMFPIRDGRGRAIGFGARAVAAGQEPKYLNSPETPLFDKGRTLYNLGPARAAAAKAGALVVTEGYMDVIALAEAGIAHAVAPLGTAITEAQLAEIWKLAPEPLVALDGDAAGLAAAQRLIDLALPLLGPSRSLRFARLPPGQDPDDVVRSGGAAAMRAILDRSEPIVALVWERETRDRVLDSPERRAALDARLRAQLAKIADAGLRAHWKKELGARREALFAPPATADVSRRSGQTARTFQGRGAARADRASAGRGTAKRSILASHPQNPKIDARAREALILGACLEHPSVAETLRDDLERMQLSVVDYATIRDALLSAFDHALTGREEVIGWIENRFGRDPWSVLLPEQLRANRALRRHVDPSKVRRTIAGQLARHVALTGLDAEVREAMQDFAVGDDTITIRVRAAAEAEQLANSRPFEDDHSDEDAEHLEFVRVTDTAEASPPRRPRKH